MKYTKKHCEAVGARIQEYDEIIARKGAKIVSCDICTPKGGCERCLFQAKGKSCLRRLPGKIRFPSSCNSTADLIARRDFLLSQIHKNGYEIVEVGG